MWLMDNKFKVDLGTCKTKDNKRVDLAELFLSPAIGEWESLAILTLSLAEQGW